MRRPARGQRGRENLGGFPFLFDLHSFPLLCPEELLADFSWLATLAIEYAAVAVRRAEGVTPYRIGEWFSRLRRR